MNEPPTGLSIEKLKIVGTFLGCSGVFVGFLGSAERNQAWTEVDVGYFA